MPEPETFEGPASQALKEVATHLKTGGPGARPLALISDSYDRKQVAEQLKNTMGTSIVMTGSLLAAADYDEKIPLAALTYVNEDYRLAKTAASMRLLVQIYSHLRKSKNDTAFKNPLAVSIMFRDVLMEMEEHRGTQELPEKACAEAYKEEFNTVRDLWNVLLKDQRDERKGRLAAYAKKFACTRSPIAYLHWGEKDAQIMEFLRSAPQEVKVKVCEAQLENNSDPEKLDSLWRGKEDGTGPDIESLAYKAQTLEEAADASQRLLYSWLSGNDDHKIGVLAYDRQLVRRLHSKLLQDGIHLQDTTGWPANNLLVGKAMLALAAAGGDNARALLRKTQNIAIREQLESGWWQTARYLAASDAEQTAWAKKWGKVSDLEKRLNCFINESKGKRRVSEWFNALADEAENGIYSDFFTKDDAAHSLRKLLRMVADEFSTLADGENMETASAKEIKRLLFDALATTSMVPSNNESPIQLVQPGRFTTREFKAVLLAGADSTNLPLARAPQLFNDEVRKSLDLPLIAEQINKQRKSLALMLGTTSNIGTVWHGEAGISPYVELIGKKGPESLLHKPIKRPWETNKDAIPPKKKPGAILHELPDKISVSSCVELLKCPYKYYAEKILNLQEDESQAIGERRHKYGTFVHEILERFHQQLEGKKSFPDEASNHLQEILNNATEENPSGFKKIKDLSLAERRYFGWELGHYVEPYIRTLKDLYGNKSFCHIKSSEKTLEGQLVIGKNTKTIQLKGQADRIDMHKEGAAIIDVKTGDPKKYQDFREYPQLPLYMALYRKEGRVSSNNTSFWVLHMEAGTISVHEVQSKKGVEITKDTPEEVFNHYKKIFTDAWEEKKELPANGVHKVCQYCSYGGLCRKKHWSRAPSNDNQKSPEANGA